MTRPEPLAPEQLRRRCDPQQFSFATTGELADVEETLGQGRALEQPRPQDWCYAHNFANDQQPRVDARAFVLPAERPALPGGVNEATLDALFERGANGTHHSRS